MAGFTRSVEISVLRDGRIGRAAIPPNIVADAAGLIEDIWRYFEPAEGAQTLSVEVLVLDHVRWDGAERAISLMRGAYEGRGDRRKPIEVRPLLNGRYLVLDGNATLTVATAAGWSQAPCLIVVGGGEPGPVGRGE